MPSKPFKVVPFEKKYDRSAFCSTSEQLNSYLRERVTQDIRRRLASCFFALDQDQRIMGFYTLSAASLLLNDLPVEFKKKLRYPSVPTIRMGRLAVDQSCRGIGLGAALLADALERAGHTEIAAWAMMVDAKDETAAQFYRHHDFISLPETPLLLFMPLINVSG